MPTWQYRPPVAKRPKRARIQPKETGGLGPWSDSGVQRLFRSSFMLWMVAKSDPTTLKPWLKPVFAGIGRGIRSFQELLGGAGVHPSTV